MKEKNLYLDSGYLNFRIVLNDGFPWSFVIGGRGTGKTYGALQTAAENFKDAGLKFIYMRRTKTQADIVSSPVFNPYKKLNMDKGWNIEPFKIPGLTSAFFDSVVDSDTGKRSPSGDYYGLITSLSTFSNFRGFDASDISLLLYDEFIRNAAERPIKDEGFALKNVYETINRNRELTGDKPLKCVCLSNSNALDNDVFVDFELVEVVEKMAKAGKNQYYLEDRGISIYNLTDSPISQKKRNTALYRMDSDGEYSKMALSNTYDDYDTSFIKSAPLAEYRPIVIIGEMCIYRHKSENQYYVTYHKSGTPESYTMTHLDKNRFIRKYVHIWEAHLQGRCFFETFLCKRMFEKMFI